MAGAGGFAADAAKNTGPQSVSGRGQTGSEKAAELGKSDFKSFDSKESHGSTSKSGSKASKFGLDKQADSLMPADDNGDDKKAQEEAQEKSKQTKKKALTAATVAAIGPASQLMFLMMVMKFLKFMFSQLMAILYNLGNILLQLAIYYAKQAVASVVTFGYNVASFVGATVSSAVAGVIGGVTAVAGVVAVGIGATFAFTGTEAGKHDALINCEDAVNAAMAQVDMGDVDRNAMMEANARTIYGVMSAWGMSDENIAGMLGNFDVESLIDPTTVEGNYAEPYQHGPRDQELESKDYLIANLPSYDWMNYPSYSSNYPLIKRLGIGLGQWTDTNDGSTGNTDLRAFAEALNKDWWALDTQLAFMISDNDGVSGVLKDYIANDKGDPAEAATWFAANWEGNTKMHQQERRDRAGKWYALQAGWEANSTLADSILAMANTTLDQAGNSKLKSKLSECITATAYADNSSLANAMISFSWVSRDLGMYNNGTYLYVWLQDQIWGPSHYADCGHAVSTAVRWSGSDDEYPFTTVATQLAYLNAQGKDKWTQVTEWNGDPSVLQPGDIFLAVNVGGVADHTVMYVGEENVIAIKGDKAVLGRSDVAHASFNSRSPTIGELYPDLSKFVVYRLVKSDNSELYRFSPPPEAKPDEGCTTCPFITTG